MSIQIGPITLSDPVILAPMSGVTDMPFRRLVKREGAGLVVEAMETTSTLEVDRAAFDHLFEGRFFLAN